MVLKDFIVPSPVILKKEQLTENALADLISHKVYGAPVVEKGKVKGVVSLLDILGGGGTIVEQVMRVDFPKYMISDEIEVLNFGELPVYPVVDDNGYYTGIINMNVINNLLRSKLNYSFHRTEAIWECTHNGILVIDKNEIITVCNSAAGRLIGIEPAKAIGKSVHEFFSEQECILPRVIDTGKPEYSQKIIINGRTLISNNTPLIMKGEIIGAIAIFQDITELERVSSELDSVRQLYNQLNAVIETSFDGIMITDSNGKGVRINSALSRLTGLDESYFIGKPINDLFRKGIFKCESITIKALQEGRTVTAVQYVNPTGKEVVVTGNPIYDHNGKMTGVMTNVRDITELIQLKEKLQETQILNERCHAELSQLLHEKLRTDLIIAESEEMKKVLNLAIKLAQTDCTVLITGESGVGKEVVARVIHDNSERAENGKFVQINCCAIPESLLEAELFGYEAGAFTGASKQGKMGLFELADKGTIMLDEIAEMPLNLQGKLLRVLQEQVVYRLGGTKPIKFDVRVIAVTNKDLWECVQQGSFREDLYYRINVIPVKIPPLRQRREDIAPLAMHFLKRCKEKHGIEKYFEPEVLSMMEGYSWPGNVRELGNVIERLVVLFEGNLIRTEHMADQFYSNEKKSLPPVVINDLLPIKDAQELIEKELLNMALNRFKTTRKAAKALGISHSSVVRKAARYNIKAVQEWNKTHEFFS